MKRRALLLMWMVGFLVGILLCEFFREGEVVKILVVVVLSGVGLWQMKILAVRVVVIFVLGAGFGFLRFLISFELPADHVARFMERESFQGCIVEEVDVRADQIKYVFEPSEGFGSGRVLVVAPRYPEFRYGECFEVLGVQVEPGEMEDFDYGKYLARYDLYSVIYRPRFERIEGNGGGVFMENLLKWKKVFEGELGEVFSEPHGSFMAGLLLGSRKGIPVELMENFNTTGLTHIIAISGYNITLIIVIVSGILGSVSRKKRIVVSSIFVVVFVIFVGASAAVVRAGIMGVLSLVALWFGRQSFVTNALVVAAFLMNLWNPKILLYDVGFQLSFLATCGLVYCSPLMEKYFQWLPKFLGMREAILMTLSAQVLALPIIVYEFGRLSLISPIANLFVLPFVPMAMLFGFLAVSLSFVLRFFGLCLGFIGYLILEVVIWLVAFFAKVPLASLDIGWFNWWMVIFYYCLIFKWILKYSAGKF